MFDSNDAIINTDDLTIEFLCEDAERCALAAESDLEEAISDAGERDGIELKVEGARVSMKPLLVSDDGALDAAIEAFADFVIDNFGETVLDAALNRATEPRS